ncbi:MAG: hypothetical protein LBV79_08670 [Candidatus Adiutrix sp.]|jgi:hypothetical protein|nr:hypothetical protein [Candidatus Adiutrix sp.]
MAQKRTTAGSAEFRLNRFSAPSGFRMAIVMTQPINNYTFAWLRFSCFAANNPRKHERLAKKNVLFPDRA